MKHPFHINKYGKVFKNNGLRPLSGFGKIMDESKLIARKFIMNQHDWDDILKFSK